MGDPAFAFRVVRRWPGRCSCCGAPGCAGPGGLDLGRPAVLGLAAMHAPFTSSTPSAKPVAQCAFSGAVPGGCRISGRGLVSHVDSWLEFGATRWGGGAVDPLGVLRERLCGQLPDAGAGVGGHATDELVDAA